MTMKEPMKTRIPCWNCKGTMLYLVTFGYYYFFRCKSCGVERAAWIHDETVTAARVGPEKPVSPALAGRGSIPRGEG